MTALQSQDKFLSLRIDTMFCENTGRNRVETLLKKQITVLGSNRLQNFNVGPPIGILIYIVCGIIAFISLR